MALFQDSVPKWLYDDLQIRYDDLLEKYHELKSMGHGPPARITQVTARPDSGQALVAGMELAARDPSIAEAAKSLKAQRPDLSEPDALREAVRLREVMTGKTTVPSLTTFG